MDNCNKCKYSEFNGITTICCYELPFPIGDSKGIKENNHEHKYCPKGADNNE